MKISPDLFHRFEGHASSSPGREVCGFVYGQEYVPLKNGSRCPGNSFRADFAMLATILAARGEPDAIFHSHPTSDLRPSEVDIRSSYYNNSIMVIGGWIDGQFRVRVSERAGARIRDMDQRIR